MSFIPVISEEKNYWLIRTNGGLFYEDFKTKGIVAVNYNDITVEDIDDLSDIELTKKIKRCYPSKQQTSRIAGQLRTFHKHIKKDDYVIITSTASKKISIGRVVDGTTEEIESTITTENKYICDYRKRKKVEWLKSFDKWDLDKEILRSIQHTQLAVTSFNDNGHLIERLLHDLFIYKGEMNLVLNVRKEGKISYLAFSELQHEIIQIVNGYAEYIGDNEFDLSNIDFKVSVQSPGKINYIGKVKVVFAISTIVTSLTGGNVSINNPFTDSELINFEMNGVASSLNEYLDANQVREQKEYVFNKYIDDLDVKKPEDFKKVMDAVNE